MSVQWIERGDVDRELMKRLFPAEVVLDVGSGIQPQRYLTPAVHICIDAHRPYLERLQRDRRSDPRFVLINGSWDVAMKSLLSKSVDTIFALDFIEHLEKDQGEAFLAEAERIARRQIVIFTPLGYYPQAHHDDQPDRWGMDGGYWQAHRSGWNIEDFDGWDLLCCKEFHFVDEHEQPLETPMGAIWGIRSFGSGDPGELTGRGLFSLFSELRRRRRARRRFRRDQRRLANS